MAESARLSALEDMLECPLCFEKSEEPKSLPCQHWFCASCVTRLIEQSSSNEFQCPSCRAAVPIPPGTAARDFPVAFMVNRLNDALRGRIPPAPEGRPKCQLHRKELDLHCDRCKVSFFYFLPFYSYHIALCLWRRGGDVFLCSD